MNHFNSGFILIKQVLHMIQSLIVLIIKNPFAKCEGVFIVDKNSSFLKVGILY